MPRILHLSHYMDMWCVGKCACASGCVPMEVSVGQQTLRPCSFILHCDKDSFSLPKFYSGWKMGVIRIILRQYLKLYVFILNILWFQIFLFNKFIAYIIMLYSPNNLMFNIAEYDKTLLCNFNLST